MYNQDLVKAALEEIRKDENHFLDFSLRLEICASFGPASLSDELEIDDSDDADREAKFLANIPQPEYIAKGHYEPTIGDLARSWLSILAARKVLPIWYEVLKKANKLDRELLEEDWTYIYADRYLINYEGSVGFAEYLILVGENILKNKKYNDLLHYMGTVLYKTDGFYDRLTNTNTKSWEDWIDQADYSGYAAFQAFIESFGDRIYDISGNNNRTIADISNGYPRKKIYKGYPAEAAHIAYAGVYDNRGYWEMRYDSHRNLEFWEWWLTEAVPQAWELAQTSF